MITAYFIRQNISQMGNFIDRTLHQRYYIRYFLDGKFNRQEISKAAQYIGLGRIFHRQDI